MKKLLIIITLITQGCVWRHDGKIVKDIDGNLYRLEASGVRNESYDLTPIPSSEIDSLYNILHPKTDK